MDRMIYTSMSGASAAERNQSILANNLANVSTNGFRAELSMFRSVPVQGEGASTRVFAMETAVGYSDKPGQVQHTDNPTDVMAKGNAWFAVQALDGSEAYTRNGALQVSTDGTLTNANGLPALSDGGGPIAVPQGSALSIGADGTITAKQVGQPPTTIGRLKMVTPSTDTPIERGPDGLFRPIGGDPLPNDPLARLTSGALEGSNVNAVETMVAMIQGGRMFSSHTQMLQTAEANDKAASQLLGSYT